ncbi:GNAT family N-acetyltransferase [Psychrobacillus lasiicapitis]|uniref:GNAT family N-acetyltransferase n=1 Tax=Psychrobacillus lasiicapitis TaxID=1636719 RepID=A0A544T4Y5_9BACI|nr:GNAT family protein [Psychrobacillus lasiicapitis]TQR12513.1 GNAT family N-acetyltransferase [Psychrobacillus lasiicapitis]GGA38739.1 N-acetyltransferase [Psychrobacillus lasiicapitis]
MKTLNDFPYLETERFLLRAIEVKDAEEVFHYFSLDEVTKYYDLDTFTSRNEAIQLIENWQKRFANNEGIRWGIATKDTNKIIGSCGYHNWEKEHFKAEVGFEVTPEYWQKGVMTEVLKHVLKYGFERMGLFRIEALYDPENTASKKTLEKAGFTYEGILRKSSFEKGQFCDAAICSILKNEYMDKEL